nr:MAG TPA: hypothetical protein [Caudoviricetes sp.]
MTHFFLLSAFIGNFARQMSNKPRSVWLPHALP